MYRIILIILGAALSIVLGGTAQAANWSRSLGHQEVAPGVTILGGMKSMGDDYWQGSGGQILVGLDYEDTPRDWPLGYTVGFFSSMGSGKKLGETSKSQVFEFQSGVRKVWILDDEGELRPYAGGGLAVGHAKRNWGDSERVGWGLGPWAGGGIRYQATEELYLGLDLRYSLVSYSMDGKKANGGGPSAAMTLTFLLPNR